MGQFMMSPLKWGTITKLGVCPGTNLKPSQNTRCHWVNRCPQEICEGKGQHTMCGQFSLATGQRSLLAYSKKSPRLTVIQKIVEFYGSTGTISHFGERFRGEQYTVASFLFAPHCSTCPAICKRGGTPPCPVVPDPLSGARPSVMVWGQVI